MTTQVLYRKWRPQTFQEITGQGHVSTVLKQAVKQGRISHAYLFSGPRGTGKTTTARVLAKAINCLEPQDGEPDNVCSICKNAALGRSMDLIEMDAASTRGIDDIRSIREKVHFAPTEGKYRVYILDEAHMLTEAAANAFLKTLEEPPSHIVFVLCTTEPEKIPLTIISRCQRFDFRRLSTEAIVTKLHFVCDRENIQSETKALQALARAASGSMRDAENLLEQVVLSYGPKTEVASIEELLGLGDSEVAKDLVEFLLIGNTTSALATIDRASRDGADLRQIYNSSLELLRTALMIQCGVRDTFDIDTDILKDMETLAQKVSLTRVMRCLKALGEMSIRFDGNSALPLEMAIIEASLDDGRDPHPVAPDAPAGAQRTQAPPIQPIQEVTPPPRNVHNGLHSDVIKPRLASDPTTDSTRKEMPDAPHEPLRTTGTDVPEEAWNQVVQALRRHKGKRFFLGALLKGCKLPHLEDNTMVLPFSHRSNMERMEAELEEVESRVAIEEALQQFLGSSYAIQLILHDSTPSNDRPASATSPLVRAVRAMGGRVLEERKIDE